MTRAYVSVEIRVDNVYSGLIMDEIVVDGGYRAQQISPTQQDWGSTMELQNMAGVVTGAHKGLGAEIVGVIGEQGGSVVALSRSGRVDGEAPEGVTDMRGDVTQEQTFLDAIQLCIDTYGRFDFIVNNAGILGESRIHETTNELWDG